MSIPAHRIKAFISLIQGVSAKETTPQDPIIYLTDAEAEALRRFDQAGLPFDDIPGVMGELLALFRIDYEYALRLYAARNGSPLPSEQRERTTMLGRMRRGWRRARRDKGAR